MDSRLCLVVALLCISSVYCISVNSKEIEELCLKRYKSGSEFDMKNALGEWYPIYYWPPNHEKLDKCAKATFKPVAASDIKDCRFQIPKDESIVEMKYASDNFEVTRYLYGAGDAKTLVDCKSDNAPQYKVVHSDLGNGKLLAAICPTGSAVLLSRNLISASELEPLVESVDVMKGINGASECQLP